MGTYIPIFLASDDNYVPFVATTIASICYNTSVNVKFYIISDGISLFHKRVLNDFCKKFAKIEVEYLDVDCEAVFSSINICNNIPRSTFSRLILPTLCSEERILYSDVDVVFLGDIAEFYEQDLSGYSLGAVYHSYFDGNTFYRKILENNLGLTKGQMYFYAGNMLIDCGIWRRDNIAHKLLELGSKKQNRINYGDQDILNMFFDVNFKVLDNRFCFTSKDSIYFKKNDYKRYQKLRETLVVRHFESDRKPWLTDMYSQDCPLDNFDDFWFFASMTPFYDQLVLRFMLNSRKDTPPSLMNNIKLPSSNFLKSVRQALKSEQEISKK